MADVCDVVVLGTGPAAGQVATRCADGGMSVTIVEVDQVGGTCALRGCNPKKVLVHAAELLDAVERSQSHLIKATAPHIPWHDLIAFSQRFVEPVTKNALVKYASKGIRVLNGQARFVGTSTIAAGEHVLEARHIVVATGAIPTPLKFPGAEHVVTSDNFLQLRSLPPRVLFLGGGYISFEFAHVAARAGAKVTIAHRGERPLKGFEPTLVDRLVATSRDIGIAVELNAEACEVQRDRDGGYSIVALRDGHPIRLSADLVVHGAGRSPQLWDLDLEVAGVTRERDGITVTEALRSVSNRSVFAAGDCAATAQPKLTPVADEEGRAIALTLLERKDHRPSYGPVPQVVFTVPPLASIGLTESKARSSGSEFDVHMADTTDWTTNRKIDARAAGYKVLVEKRTERILGAHLLGPSADETINLFALAIKHDLRAKDLQSVLFAYPTFASDVRRMV